MNNDETRNRFYYKNFHLKLLVHNITLFILRNLSLEKIKSDIKTNISFFHLLMKEANSIKKSMLLMILKIYLPPFFQ